MSINQTPLLHVQNLRRQYGQSCKLCAELTGPEQDTNICSNCGGVVACLGIDFKLFHGEVLGIVGESGSGKSTILRCLNFDEMPTTGEIYHSGVNNGVVDLFSLSAQRRRSIQNTLLGIVYQSPHLGLDLNLSAGANVAERLLIQRNTPEYKKIRKRSFSLLDRVQFPLKRIDDSPRDFSGGMQQRIQISKALAPNPMLLFLDEPTSGLDVSIQASVLDLIASLQRETRVAMIIVSHDLGVIRLLTQRTIVMKTGRIVERGLTDQILEDPQHPYTQQLVASAL